MRLAIISTCRQTRSISDLIRASLAAGQPSQLKKHLKITGWLVYILGVPAWAVILIGEHDWIAASIQVGAVPAMLLGLYNSYYENQQQQKLFTLIVVCCTYVSLTIGLSYSIYHHAGITAISQVLEIAVMFGFLLGSYAIANNNAYGWCFFMLMNLSMAALMLLQGKTILMLQQLVSLGFVVYGFKKSLWLR